VIRAGHRDTLRYRIAFFVHRASGVGVLLFVLLHVADVSLVRLGPKSFDMLVFVYRQAFFRGLEILLMGAVLFHAFNGLRITVQDAWPGWLRHGRSMLWASYLLTVAGWVPSAYFMAVR
jgi:succinate dehydrogenase / fumarate reductase cytochrome b subunit